MAESEQQQFNRNRAPQGHEIEEPVPVLSCDSCRSRKLRCSRELPACQQCRKAGNNCQYKREKRQPGMKPGAIESLHRRLDYMEDSIEQLKSTSNEQRLQVADQTAVQSVMSVLAQEIHKLSEGTLSPIALNENSRPHKRMRTEYHGADIASAATAGMPQLPSSPVLDQIIDTYFSRIHPWIPMLQENRFKQRLSDPNERLNLLVVLQAMIIAAARQVNAPINDLDERRNWVIATSMSSLVIESLQALTIVAFNDIARGLAMRAWPIVGSLTRTVEYLQLTIEKDDVSSSQPLSKPYITIHFKSDGPGTWIELEERRRTFWVIFTLDRFCSITMGWNTSLTSDDVRRRLPCDITLWWQDDPVKTPYFNIWDKSASRIGKPIAFAPSHHDKEGYDNRASPGSGEVPGDAGVQRHCQQKVDATSPDADLLPIDGSTIGAYAYSIEAVESLSQVTTYFLQQRIDMRDERAIESWLTRFKELDLRLIHWKMLLPQKWKPDMERSPGTVRMDPNLTLAHVTHNTSIVLLHQPIAFPRLDWVFKSRLPSSSSAETCYTAASMVAAIVKNYLDMLPQMPVAPLFAFCVFICARALLIHWRYYEGTKLAPEFEALVASLDCISAQWRGTGVGAEVLSDTLAGLYASRLRLLRQQSLENERLRIDPSEYTLDGSDSCEGFSAIGTGGPGSYLYRSPSSGRQMMSPKSAKTTTAPISMLESSSLAYHRDQHPRLPEILTPTDGQSAHLVTSNNLGMDHGTMESISQLFLDSQFINVDRIISLEDDIFDVSHGSVSWD